MKIVNGICYVIIIISFVLWIYGRKQTRQSGWFLFLHKHIYLLTILFAANTASLVFSLTRHQGEIYVQREDYDGSEKEIGVVLQSGTTEEEIYLTVSPRTLTKTQQTEKMQEAFTYLDDHIKGTNKSLDHVTDNLDITLDSKQFPFEEEIRPDDYSLLDEEGNIRNDEDWLLEQGYSESDIQAGIKTGITITLWYGTKSQEQYYEMVIFQKEKNYTEKLFADIRKQLMLEEQRTTHEDGFTIPAVMDTVSITPGDGGECTPIYVLICGFLICGLLILREKEAARQAEKQKQAQLLRCYPWFVNEMVLMLGAGMQVKNIIALLLADYEKEERKGADDREPLMAELLTANQSLHMGMPEQQVYYQLGRRLKLPCYIKLMTLLEQNVKRGTKGLSIFFEQEEAQALEDRKNLAKQYGEEAGTKLLGPMIILLLVIMLMIMIPAFMSFY